MPTKKSDKKPLGEYTLLELIKMAGKGVGEGIKKGAKASMDIMPLNILAKMIGGATAQNPFTTPVKDVGRNMLIGMSVDEGVKALKGVISEKQKENAKKDPIGLANIIGNIQNSEKEIDVQAIQDLIGSDSKMGNTASASPATITENPATGDFPNPGNMSAGTESAGTSPANTGATATAGKKGYGWPIALMMMGKGLQGGNPMDVLAGLMQNEQFNKQLSSKNQQFNKEFDESTRQFDEKLALDKEKLETDIAVAQTTAEQNAITLKLRNIEAMTAMVNSVKDFSNSVLPWGGKDTNKLMQNIEKIYGKTMQQLEGGRETAPESIPTNLVEVINPKGEKVRIEKSQLQGALKSGYKRAK